MSLSRPSVSVSSACSSAPRSSRSTNGATVASLRIKHLSCSLHGHYPALTIEPGYLVIACMECRTRLGPGWRLERVAFIK